jgi:hypothetical protein
MKSRVTADVAQKDPPYRALRKGRTKKKKNNKQTKTHKANFFWRV